MGNNLAIIFFYCLTPSYTVDKMTIPNNIKEIMTKLISKGFEAYIIGGAVRDYLLGVTPHDYDIFTNATGEEILSLFPSGKIMGGEERQEKILTVIYDGVEISQYRENGDRTKTGDNLKDHVMTCDFTINALAMDIKEHIIDLVNGEEDLRNEILRFVGNPIDRIKEDPLRLLRGVRFAGRFDLDFSDFTPFIHFKPYLDLLPKERIREEFIKILKTRDGLKILFNLNMLYYILPKFEECYNISGGDHHEELVHLHLFHSFEVAKKITDDYRIWLVALLHDIGKGETFVKDPEIHFYNHEVIGAEYVKEWMEEYKFSNDDIKFVTTLVRQHMWGYKEKCNNNTFIKKINVLTDAKCSIYDFVKMIYCDNQGNADKRRIKYGDFVANTHFLNTYWDIKTRCLPFKLTDLEIGGRDLINLGIPEGQEIGKTLLMLFNEVIEGKLLNRKDRLLEKLGEVITKG